MNEFIEKNERFLRLCCNVARFSGLFLIAFAAFILIPILWLGVFCDGSFVAHSTEIIQTLPRVVLRIVFPAFLLLGIEQLIRCLIDINFKPNWILRFGDKIIYLYAIILLINFIYTTMYINKMIYPSTHNISYVLSIFLPSAIFTFFKILLWICIGLVLRRIVPIIEESKALV